MFIAGILGLNPPQTVARLCALSLFFGWDNELQKNFLSIYNKQTDEQKLFVTKQSKGCKFMSKMHQNTFGGRTHWAEAYALLQIP